MSYTLAEVSPLQMDEVLSSAWRQCTGALAIVEPGTPAGYARILRTRDLLKAQGARIAAPCPHELGCPLISPDWCHFAQRISRTRDHMLLKSAELPYEDEKFSYLAVVREHLFSASEHSRIVARPEISRAAVTAKLCQTNGGCEFVTIGRRDADFKALKRNIWGDEI